MPFSESTLQSINNVFRNASADGRRMLYEHEIYQILNFIGLATPRFVFVPHPSSVNQDLLDQFGSQVVCKIISPQIAHKQKVGGVKIVRHPEPLYLQFVLTRMTEEVSSHYSADRQAAIRGYLIVEYVPHTQALGNEVLIGFKHDPAFGPVVTLTKGGDDAEFFAQYFDPANLFLPPLEYDSALRMLHTLHIKHKFEQNGHLQYLEHMAEATARLSALAEWYSIIARRKPEFIIQSFEVNPFVITKDGRFVAIDGFAQFAPATEAWISHREINLQNVPNFFHPRGIAVVGVSTDMSKYSLGREIGRLLHDMGRADLFFINNRGGSLALGNKSYTLFPRLQDLPCPVELVVYAAPAQSTMDFVKELKGSGVRALILISGIPSNIKYSEYAGRLSEAMPEAVRVIGPNCMGVFHGGDNNDPGLNTLFIEEKRLEVKASSHANTALLTQSGAFAVTAIDKLQNARLFRTIVSFGNKFDVNITDLMAYCADEESINVIAIYLEGLDPAEGRQFFQLAKAIKKPIIVYKSGRTEAGARAAASHTASMSGSYDVFKAACVQAGVILAENIEDHYDYVKVFSSLARRIPGGNRVAGVVNAGFESTVGADELKNLKQALLSESTVTHLNRINRFGLVDTSSPFLDLTPMADDQMCADFVEALLQDDGVDCIFVALVPHSVALKTIPENCRDPKGVASLLVELSRRYRKPMVISVNAGRYYQDFVSIMEQNGLPVYTDIRSAIKSLDRFVSYHLNLVSE